MAEATPTQTMRLPSPATVEVKGFRMTVLEGPRAGASWISTGATCSIGSDARNDLVIDAPTVSRFHCEVRLTDGGGVVSDLDSKNGTIVDGVVVYRAMLRAGSVLRLGEAAVRFQPGGPPVRIPLSDRAEFGELVGGSVPMRAVYACLERAARSDATVLLEGETGTGKGAAAVSLHRASPRGARPFVVVDCGAIPANLLESELFGHERGAFTGAESRRIGAFEEADGGTVFLDEIGELPLELQPKLLRVLENREVRRLGMNAHRPVDVRVVAATNRDLRADVNAGRFRADLYFRLAVVRVTLPPLRQRAEDLPQLVDRVARSLGAGEAQRRALGRPEHLEPLARSAWQGNVRELRNYIERALVLDDTPVTDEVVAPEPDLLRFTDARQQALLEFERRYLRQLMERHRGRLVAAAAAADINRVYLYRLLKKHDLR
jgi:DNA-binding NtrC family response regulator